MNYPVKCKRCNNPIYGPVQYCPFCGTMAAVLSLTVNTNPGGAVIFLNGERKGNSPLIVSDLKEGNYTVRVESEGYITKEEQITLGQEKQAITIELEKITPKPTPAFLNLTVNTNPGGAVIFLNGERKGNSPLIVSDLKEGNYTVRVESEGYITKEEQITLGQEKQAITIELKKRGKSIFARVVTAIIILAIGYFVYTNLTSDFLSKIDRALAEKRYLSPPGNSVADFYRAKKAKDPNSPELKDAVSRIRQKLEPIGDAAFQQLYSDSIDTDWDNTVNIYKLLNAILPDDRDMAAKAEFCQAHQIIKGKKKKNYVDALARYEKALELKPNWVFAINGIAKVYVRKDSPYYNKEEALNWYRKVSETDPNFPWAYTNIAAIHMEDKQWDMAEQALLSALRLKNNSPSIFTELGKACEKQQKTQDAQNYYQEAMKYERDSEKIAWLQKKISAIQQP
jgi:tetratricopeptide (TPR) repeat protein